VAVNAPPDPVLARRAQVARLTVLGKRVGYGLFAVAVVCFFLGVATRFSGFLTGTVVFCLGVGSAVLAPAIVFGYGVKAADRADRDGGW
jgi:hypothetical protein